MIQKIKDLILGWMFLVIVVLLLLVLLASYKSTDQVYVCSGIFQEYNKPGQLVNVKFEVKDSYSIYNNRSMIISMFDNAPYVFYHSKDTSVMSKNSKTIFAWDKTYLGKDLSIYVSHRDSQVISFDFNTKILNATFWVNSGNIKAADYNLLCKEVKQ